MNKFHFEKAQQPRNAKLSGKMKVKELKGNIKAVQFLLFYRGGAKAALWVFHSVKK